MSESNFGPVLKTKWPPYHNFNVKWGGYQKAVISPFSLVPGVWNKKTTYWKSWSANLLKVSNLTFDPCFKVMQGHHAKRALYLPYNWF